MQTLSQSRIVLCWHIHKCQTLLLLAALLVTVVILCRAGIATSLCNSCEQAHARSNQLSEEKEALCTEVHLLATSSQIGSQTSNREASACSNELPSHVAFSRHRIMFFTSRVC